jgi:hypothetical protein
MIFIISFIIILSILSNQFACISHNVPAVYEVLSARIDKRKGVQYILNPPLRLQGTQNLAERKPHKGRKHD